MFELECAWRYLSAGGVIVVDDIDANPAFDTFTKAHPEHPSFVCTAEPLSPDMRRFNQKGLFGIICKQSSQDADTQRASRPHTVVEPRRMAACSFGRSEANASCA
jgi:hypothetical protein